MHVGSGGALRAWKALNSELQRHFNKAMPAITTLNYQWKSSIILVSLRKHHFWNTVKNVTFETHLYWRKNRMLRLCTIEPIQYFLFVLDKNGCRCTNWGCVNARPYMLVSPKQRESYIFSCWNIESTETFDDWAISNNHLPAVFILGIF